ncbi:MAG: alpha-galactosidase [Cyclobacteriaceae bacterium]|nr:alpha-galactosidase [Cyclobacteriaceae bacterium]
METLRHVYAGAFFCSFLFLFSCSTEKPITVGNAAVQVQLVGSARELIVLSIPGSSESLGIGPPEFEIDGTKRKGVLRNIHQVGEGTTLKNNAVEYVFTGTMEELPDAELRIILRIPASNPVVRFRYELSATSAHTLTKEHGADNLLYFSASLASMEKVKEIRFSEFNEMVHSFSLSERILEKRHFDDSISAMGPLIFASNSSHSFILGYEHGSQVPDAFLQYQLNPDGTVSLEAVKGNYSAGEKFSSEKPFSTVWLEAAMVAGGEQAMASTYRSFVLNDMTENLESRKPYIFYNTWNYQERMKHWYKKPYLDSMNLKRITREIDVAHRMGIEVFVIDAGWFEKTGDWKPSPTRFPDGLKDVKAQLDRYGMKLGLWFNPTVAAQSSKMYLEPPEVCPHYEWR